MFEREGIAPDGRNERQQSPFEARPLTEDEKWGKPMKDDWHGSVRPRVHCEEGGRLNPYSCLTPATWLVGRKKLCKRHMEAAT